MKLPHMPLWVYDIESDEDCRRMGDADFGRYMRLLIRQWIEGSVPSAVADVVRVAMLDSGADAAINNLLETKFEDAGDGRKINKRCDIERREIIAKIETNRRNGKKRHRQRPLSDRSSELTATAIANAPANTQQHAYDSDSISDSGSLSSSSPPSEKRTRKVKPESLAEVESCAVEIGLPETEAAKFFNYYTSNGWRVGRNPMKDWHAALNNWKKTYDNGTYSNGSGGTRGTRQTPAGGAARTGGGGAKAPSGQFEEHLQL